MKIKIFRSTNLNRLESVVNKFLETHEAIQFQYTTGINDLNNFTFSVMIVYFDESGDQP